MNEKSFSHICRNGTRFFATRCDFRDGIVVQTPPKDKFAFGADVAEMIGYHACNIWPELNGFQGYDCVHFSVENPKGARPAR